HQLPANLGNEGALLWHDIDQAVAFKPLQRLANRRAAQAELIGQAVLGQQFTRLEREVQDALLDAEIGLPCDGLTTQPTCKCHLRISLLRQEVTRRITATYLAYAPRLYTTKQSARNPPARPSTGAETLGMKITDI